VKGKCYERGIDSIIVAEEVRVPVSIATLDNGVMPSVVVSNADLVEGKIDVNAQLRCSIQDWDI